MTTITREHLELAAKGARYGAVTEDENGWFRVEKCRYDKPELWNPHKDTADTWQLAADCKMTVDHPGKRIWFPIGLSAEGVLLFGDDVGRTAMEAVTLAAAEIGRAMG